MRRTGTRPTAKARRTAEREQAIRFGVLPDETVAPWTEIEEGRYQPRRIRGSLRGRELG